MKKRISGRIYYGDWVSDVSGIVKGQRGFWVSGGTSSGRSGGSMGGLFHGGIHSRVGDYGYDVYGMGGDLVYNVGAVDWRRDSIDLKDIYKTLGQLKKPVDIGKLFDISGIKTGDLLPSDMNMFNAVAEALQNKYLREIQKASPNLTQEDLMKPDVNFKVNELSMKFQGHIQKLYNELLANKKQFDKDADIRKELERMYGSGILSKSSVYADHYNVSERSSFKDYIAKHGGDMGKALGDIIVELESTGTLSGLTRLSGIRSMQGLNLDKQYQQLAEKVRGDSYSDLKALSQYAYQTTTAEELGAMKVKATSYSGLASIMNNQENKDEIAVKAAKEITDVLRNVTGDSGAFIFYDKLEDARSSTKQMFEGNDYAGAKEMIEILRSGSEAEKARALGQLDLYLMTNKKRDIVGVNRKILVKDKSKLKEGTKTETINGKTYAIEKDYVSAYIDKSNNPSLKEEYVLLDKDGGKEVVVDKEDYEANKEKYKGMEIGEIREVPMRVIDVDEKDMVEYLKRLAEVKPNNSDIAQNVAVGTIYKELVSKVMPKVYTEQKLSVDLRDATNISVKAVGNAGGGEIERDKMAEWVTFASERILSKDNPGNFNAMITRQFDVNGNLYSNLDGKKDKGVYVIKVGLQNTTLGEAFKQPNNLKVFNWYNAKTGKEMEKPVLTPDTFNSIQFNLGMAFKVGNRLQLFKLPEETVASTNNLKQVLINGVGSNEAEVNQVINGAMQYYTSNPAKLKQLISGIEIKDNPTKENIVDAIIEKVRGLSSTDKYSVINKIMTFYLNTTANSVMGALAKVNGEEVFIEHSDETIASNIGNQYETARNATFGDRYEYLKPLTGLINKISSSNKITDLDPKEKEAYKKLAEGITSTEASSLKEKLNGITKVAERKDVAKRILKQLEDAKKLYEDKDYRKKVVTGIKDGGVANQENLYEKSYKEILNKIKVVEEVLKQSE